MSNATTFGAFTTARLGIYASQKGLAVTGNNITNINTTGYTRQTLDQVSLKVGTTDRYQSVYSTNVGSGVLCTGVSQIRDPYLDIRYRNEQANVGAMDSKLAALEDLSSVFDEVGMGDGDGVMEKQFNDLVAQLQTLSTHVGQSEYDSLVRSSATTLVQLFNSYSGKISDIAENQETGFRQDLTTVNTVLQNIRDLNASIRRSELHGDDALELRDQRNNLIDSLSQYIKIDVSYGTEDIGAGQTVEKLVIKLGGSDTALVDGIYGTQLSLRQEPVSNPDYDNTAPDTGDNLPYLNADGDPTADLAQAAMQDTANFDLDLSALTSAKGVVLDGSGTVNLGDNDLFGALQSTREMLTEKGEYSTAEEIAVDANAATKRGIPYYQKALDALANKFASVFNSANTYTNSDGDVVGGNLFSNSGNGDDGTGITAANLSISASWANGSICVLNTKEESSDASQDNTNIIHMLTLIDSKQAYKASELGGASDVVYFTGSFQEMLSNMNAILANDTNTTTTLLNNYAASATELNTNRDSVSGVDLNDEAASLMQYQKSYSAACRLMTTIDETLDKLINSTGAVGR